MNADRFLDLVEHPEFARDSDVNALEQLVRQYPYFSLAHMLLAKISAETNMSSSNPFMQNALLVVPDREVFIDFLKKKEPKPSEEEWMISAASSSDIAMDGNSNLIMEEASEEEALQNKAGEGEATTSLEGQLQEKILEEESEEFDLWNKSGGTGSENSPVRDPIEEEDEEHFAVEEDPEIISSTVLEEEFVMLEKESWMKNEKDLQPELSLAEDRLAIAAASESLGEKPVAVENQGSFLPDKKISFVGWLQFFKKNKKAPQAPSRKTKTETEAPNNIPTVSLNESEDASFMQEELTHIDKIVSEIKTGNFYKPSAENISAPELAKKSIELGDEVLSETLAQIYEEQGIYDKAIRMYARLSLKYPEKMATFASRIKALKKKKNNSA